MSRGLGVMQRRILEWLAAADASPSWDHRVIDYYHYNSTIWLAPGVYDIRLMSRDLCDDGRGFRGDAESASFYRALKSVAAKGTLDLPRYARVVHAQKYAAKNGLKGMRLKLDDEYFREASWGFENGRLTKLITPSQPHGGWIDFVDYPWQRLVASKCYTHPYNTYPPIDDPIPPKPPRILTP